MLDECVGKPRVMHMPPHFLPCSHAPASLGIHHAVDIGPIDGGFGNNLVPGIVPHLVAAVHIPYSLPDFLLKGFWAAQNFQMLIRYWEKRLMLLLSHAPRPLPNAPFFFAWELNLPI